MAVRGAMNREEHTRLIERENIFTRDVSKQTHEKNAARAR